MSESVVSGTSQEQVAGQGVDSVISGEILLTDKRLLLFFSAELSKFPVRASKGTQGSKVTAVDPVP